MRRIWAEVHLSQNLQQISGEGQLNRLVFSLASKVQGNSIMSFDSAGTAHVVTHFICSSLLPRDLKQTQHIQESVTKTRRRARPRYREQRSGFPADTFCTRLTHKLPFCLARMWVSANWDIKERDAKMMSKNRGCLLMCVPSVAHSLVSWGGGASRLSQCVTVGQLSGCGDAAI